MAYLQCPRCSTTVEERPGVRTVCPKCGFSGDPPQNYDVRHRHGQAGQGQSAPASESGGSGGHERAYGSPQPSGSPYSPYPSSSSYSSAPYGASGGTASYSPPSNPVPQQQPAHYPYAPAQPTNGMAVAALVMGITGFCVGVTAILAIIFGVIGRQQCRERNEKGEGMATAGIVLGSIAVGLFLLWLLFVFSFSGFMGMLGAPGA